MNSKLYQVVDNVHSSIYYSDVEKAIMRTPYFNRLHDVNQSSTVYFTFPPNRTKRYEHSLGTMQITSDIFFNAVANSTDNEAGKILFNSTEENLKNIFNFIINMHDYAFKFDEIIMNKFLYFRNKDFDDIKGIIRDNFYKCFSDNYLLRYIPNSLNDDFKSLLFLSLIQSLRIIGLLHDCGHPPESHIIETVLNEIYDEVSNKEEKTNRQKNFIAILNTYRDSNNGELSKIDNKMAIRTTSDIVVDQLHEMIGLQVIYNIFSTIFPEFLSDDLNANADIIIVKLLYHLSLIEFSFAIIRNKSNFWRGLHDIIDGIIDSDRLDFVNRDSMNSGMVWGSIPYKRLINSAKFEKVSNITEIENDIRICFSEKSIDAMDELIRSRYKIFAYINYHHRSTRIATLYQLAVKIIALEYLDQSEEDHSTVSFNDISGLWRSIQLVYSPILKMFNIIQWNDSWLNGLLCEKYIELSSKSKLDSSASNCLSYLESIFLNKKNFTSLIKRNSDQRQINEIIFNTTKKLRNKLKEEIDKIQIRNIKTKRELSLGAFKKDQTKIKKEKLVNDNNILIKELECINESIVNYKWFDLEKELAFFYEPAINNVMTKYKISANNYIIKKIYFSLGLTGNAYLYDYNDNVKDYVKNSSIKCELKCTHKNFPYYYIFIKLDTDKPDSSILREEIGVEIGNIITQKCKDRYSLNFT